MISRSQSPAAFSDPTSAQKAQSFNATRQEVGTPSGDQSPRHSDPPKKGVQIARVASLANRTPFQDREVGALSTSTMAELAASFRIRGHQPSPVMLDALQAAVTTMEAMAEGRCQSAIYLSGLDPGVGKTSALIVFLKTLIKSERHSDVGALVCLQRLEQIRSVVAEAALDPKFFAVEVGDAQTKALSGTPQQSARIVFTTHALFERRCGSGNFCDTPSYHYQDQPRQVRIWDEAILPGAPLTIKRLTISSLAEPVSFRYPALAADLEKLGFTLRDVADGSRIELPDLADKHGVDLNEMLGLLSDPAEARRRRSAETLWWLLGKTVTVRREGKSGETLLDYRDTLPADLAPVLVLDASVRVREVYSEWARGRKGIVNLPSAPKSYANLTLHVWPHAGGKSAFEHPTSTLR